MRQGVLTAMVAAVELVKPAMPSSGMSVAAFEALALGGVAPQNVDRAIAYLHNQGVIYLRRNRGDVRVFADRPASTAGVFGALDEVDRLLSAVASLMRRIALDLEAREAAKKDSDTVAANEARDRLAATGGRVVAAAQKRVGRGVPFEAIRRGMWDTYSSEIMDFLSLYEPALMRGATGEPPKGQPSPRRITNGLSDGDKVLALVAKAGERGLTKSDLVRAIRPKPRAERLGAILSASTRDGALQARRVRVRGSRFATRYFLTTIDGAAEAPSTSEFVSEIARCLHAPPRTGA